MSSPIHKYLFSPPPSPPSRCADETNPVADVNKAHGLTSIKGLLLPTDMLARASLDGSNELKARSPRTPLLRQFTLDNAYPSPGRLLQPTVMVEDTEEKMGSPRILSSPVEHQGTEKEALPANIPSATIPMPSALPRPLLRLLLLASLVISSVMLLVYVPEARLPSLKAAATSRRLALSPDGKAYYDVANAVNSWEEAKDRDYRPPQVRVKNMKRAAMAPPSTDRAFAPMPQTTRKALTTRPVPQSHELLALQSYLLQSVYNILPDSVDPRLPLDAHAVLNVGANKLGASGSDAEKEWLADLEREREDDVVVWYGADGALQPPHALLDVLAALHGKKRKPTMIPVQGRQDLPLLRTFFNRLSIPISHHPLVMIGNTPIVGDIEGIEELRGSGRLRDMLSQIGWIEEDKKQGREKVHWKPKLAKVQKRELSEVERALKHAK